jgi:hypothetical protein
MNIFGRWKLFYLIITPFIIYALIRYFNFNIIAYSPLSPTGVYDPTLIFPSSLVLTVFTTLFIVNFGWYFGYNLDQYKLTLRTYKEIIELIKSVNYELFSNDKDSTYDESREEVKEHLKNLPNFLFTNLKLNDKEETSSVLSYSMGQIKRPENISYNIKKNEGLDLIRVIIDDSNIEKSYRRIYELMAVIHGINYTDTPAFLYRSVVVNGLILNTVLVPYNWASYSWLLGSIIISIQIIVLYYMIDGVKNITPVFNKTTQGYRLMEKETDECTSELEALFPKKEVVINISNINKPKPSLRGKPKPK